MTTDNNKPNYSWITRWKSHCKENVERAFYKWSVDVSSGWLYYTTAYGLQELAAGQDPATIIKTRSLGMLVHAAVMRPIGKLRNHIARRMQVTQESSLLDKMKVNALATVPIQSVAYAGMLAGGMALSGHYDWKSSLVSWGLGMALSIPHSLVYGPFQDSYRNLFGVQPAIKKTENSSLETYAQNP
ncbi:MAG TPA: L-alanine exporter AlaE [Candidatus Nanoarchaeia archaeon]|nr:L-alanine exporter AlaE [Candidatus Nanoarchaeia archaeon]